MKVTSVARAPARIPFKKRVGRFVRDHTQPYDVRTYDLITGIQRRHELMLNGGGLYSDIALALQVDDANPTPIRSALSFDAPQFFVPLIALTFLGMLGLTASADEFVLDPLELSAFFGGMATAPVVFSYLATTFIGMKKVASLHNTETLYNLVSRPSKDHNKPKAAVINYIRGVIKQPGHDDIKEKFLEQIIQDRVLKEPHKRWTATLVVAFYDLFSPDQKQRLLEVESGEKSVFNAYEAEQSVLRLFVEDYQTIPSFDYSFAGNQGIVLKNLQDFLTEVSVYKKEDAPVTASDLAFKKWQFNDLNMYLIVSALLKNTHFDSDDMIQTLVDQLDTQTLSVNLLGNKYQVDNAIQPIADFAVDLSEQGVPDDVVQCFVKAVYQKMVSGYIKQFSQNKKYREPGVLDQTVNLLIDTEMTLRDWFSVDPSEPPFLAEHLFEAFAGLYSKDQQATIEFGIDYLNAYSVTWIRRFDKEEESLQFKFIPNFINWLKESLAPVQIKTLMAHIVTSLPNPGFVYTSDYVQVFEWVDMQYWQQFMLPRYPLSEDFYRRALSEGLLHDRNPKAYEFMQEVQVYYFLKALAKAETHHLEHVIRTHSRSMITHPSKAVHGLFKLYKAKGVSLERFIEILNANTVFRVGFQRIIKRKLADEGALEPHEMKLISAYDPMSHTAFLVEVFPEYHSESKAYYDQAGVLDKIAKLAADPKCAERDLYKDFLLGGSIKLSQHNHMMAVLTYAARLSEEYAKVVNARPDDEFGKKQKANRQQELKSAILFLTQNISDAVFSDSISQYELSWIKQMMATTNVVDIELELALVRYLNTRNRPELRGLISKKLDQIRNLKQSGLFDFDDLERGYQSLIL